MNGSKLAKPEVEMAKCMEMAAKESDSHMYHRRARRSVCQYNNIHMDIIG